VAIAISGGIDSVVLCHLCVQAQVAFILVHCNFGLRGAESERDEAFVRTLASERGVEALIKKMDTTEHALIKKFLSRKLPGIYDTDGFQNCTNLVNLSFSC
jgi:tRNA(Ile)-lysidine synthase